jgi:hypothetical protein
MFQQPRDHDKHGLGRPPIATAMAHTNARPSSGSDRGLPMSLNALLPYTAVVCCSKTSLPSPTTPLPTTPLPTPAINANAEHGAKREGGVENKWKTSENWPSAGPFNPTPHLISPHQAYQPSCTPGHRCPFPWLAPSPVQSSPVQSRSVSICSKVKL